MIKFYNRLKPIQALSFDLDDTLYDNGPVIKQAEQAFWQALTNLPGCSELTQVDYQAAKHAVASQQPGISNDVGLWRLSSCEYLLKQNLPEQEKHNKSRYSNACFEVFRQHRSQIQVSAEVIEILKKLAEKFTLLAITNGNVEVEKTALCDIFPTHQVFYANQHQAMKPASDLFYAASEQLNLPVNQFLHIGDHPITDIIGAKRAGMQSCWIKASSDYPNPVCLPDCQIERVSDLLVFL